MRWQLWIVILGIGLNAGWMTFDGLRALTVGDYVTPRNGSRAGMLGPWSKVLQAVGLEPRSSAVKVFFVFYGITGLALLVCFVLGYRWARAPLLVVAVAGLWYLPMGTVLNAVAIAALLSGR